MVTLQGVDDSQPTAVGEKDEVLGLVLCLSRRILTILQLGHGHLKLSYQACYGQFDQLGGHTLNCAYPSSVELEDAINVTRILLIRSQGSSGLLGLGFRVKQLLKRLTQGLGMLLV